VHGRSSGAPVLVVAGLLIAAPISLGIATYLSELCPSALRQPLIFLTELLAAIPSIVYGLWGVFVLVPLVRQLETALPDWLRATPLFSGPPIGLGMLSAALILAIMVTPFISSLAREVLKSVPRTQREGAYALGAPTGRPFASRCRTAAPASSARFMLGFGPRARRNDGGYDGDRQQPHRLVVAVLTAVHHGGGHGERVRRGGSTICTFTRSSKSAWCCSSSRSS
jgi:ABC-type phosphate transport system permease subunit